MSNENLITLFDDVYAVRFPYHMVTSMTLGRAIPSSFMRDVAKNRLEIKFAAESESEAKTKRANCEEIRKCFPAEVAILSGQVDDLSEYVIFKVIDAR